MNNNLLEWQRPSQRLQNEFVFWRCLFATFHEINCFPVLGFFMKAGLGMAAGATGAFVGTPAEVKFCNSRNTKRMLIFVSSGSWIKKWFITFFAKLI